MRSMRPLHPMRRALRLMPLACLLCCWLLMPAAPAPAQPADADADAAAPADVADPADAPAPDDVAAPADAPADAAEPDDAAAPSDSTARAGSAGPSQKYPEPSPYPLAWELTFEHGKPKRIVVDVPGRGRRAFWYMTYRVTNETEQDQEFLPFFEMVTSEGEVLRSDRNIPRVVFDTIKARERNEFLEPATKIAGIVRVGEDQARDGVAIWPEPERVVNGEEMGSFSIFITGISGEVVTYKIVKGELVPIEPAKAAEQLKGVKEEDIVILRKTLQLNYIVTGDNVRPDRDEVHERPEEWVMR